MPRLLGQMRLSDLGLVAVVTVAALAARAAILFVLLPLLDRLRLSPHVERPYRLAILWGGLRGRGDARAGAGGDREPAGAARDPARGRDPGDRLRAVHADRAGHHPARRDLVARARQVVAARHRARQPGGRGRAAERARAGRRDDRELRPDPRDRPIRGQTVRRPAGPDRQARRRERGDPRPGPHHARPDRACRGRARPDPRAVSRAGDLEPLGRTGAVGCRRADRDDAGVRPDRLSAGGAAAAGAGRLVPPGRLAAHAAAALEPVRAD